MGGIGGKTLAVWKEAWSLHTVLEAITLFEFESSRWYRWRLSLLVAVEGRQRRRGGRAAPSLLPAAAATGVHVPGGSDNDDDVVLVGSHSAAGGLLAWAAVHRAARSHARHPHPCLQMTAVRTGATCQRPGKRARGGEGGGGGSQAGSECRAIWREREAPSAWVQRGGKRDAR